MRQALSVSYFFGFQKIPGPVWGQKSHLCLRTRIILLKYIIFCLLFIVSFHLWSIFLVLSMSHFKAVSKCLPNLYLSSPAQLCVRAVPIWFFSYTTWRCGTWIKLKWHCIDLLLSEGLPLNKMIIMLIVFVLWDPFFCWDRRCVSLLCLAMTISSNCRPIEFSLRVSKKCRKSSPSGDDITLCTVAPATQDPRALGRSQRLPPLFLQTDRANN